ncbi:MAG: endonuclease domain-containing protein [Microvirga sp.]
MRGLRLPETRRARGLRRTQTPAEARLWSKLRNRGLAGHKFVRQEPIGPYFADFLCRERALIVEVDGATHSTDEELAQDARRTEFLEAKGYTVLRVLNTEVVNELDGVLERIFLALEQRAASGLIPQAPHPDPLPPSGARERNGERE